MPSSGALPFPRKHFSVAYLCLGVLAAALDRVVSSALVHAAVLLPLSFSAAGAVLLGVRLHRPARRLPWYLIAAGQAAAGLNWVFWQAHVVRFGDTLASGPVADWLRFASYGLFVVALALLLVGREARSVGLLDSALVAVGVGLVAWVFLFAGYARTNGLSSEERAVHIGFAFADVLVFALVVRLLIAARWRLTAFTLLLAAACSLTTANLAWNWLDLLGAYAPGRWTDAGWLLFHVFVGASALHPSMPRLFAAARERATAMRRPQAAALAAAVLAAPAALVAEKTTGVGDDDCAIAVAGASLGLLVAVRLVLALRAEARTRAELAARTERLLDAERLTGLGHWEWDIAADRISWSEELYRLAGLDPDEFEASYEAVLATVHPDEREAVDGFVRRALETCEFGEIEYRLVRPDGSVRIVQGRGRVIADVSGRAVRLLGTGQGVTERAELEREYKRLLEERLQASEERFRAFMNNSPTLAWATDEDGRYVYASRSFEEAFGLDRDEWRGRTRSDLFPAELAAELQRDDQAVLASQEPIEREREVLTSSRGLVTWLSLKFPFADAGGSRLVGGIAVDITDRVRAEAARDRFEQQFLQAQKMEAVGLLAGGVAHDFNNMMSAVVGFSELVLAELGPADPLRAHVGEIHRAGQRASAITNRLLAFSRKQVLEPRVLDLNEVVAGTEKLLERLIGEDVEIVSVLEPRLDAVEVDPGQLEQVIVNLAVNARDAMPRGGQLTIETANVSLDDDYAASHFEVEPGGYVLLAVSDTGAGMDAVTRGRIFEPYFTTKEPGKGTGLGLAAVFEIVKQSGGDISVSSEPGRGTTFRIYLPRAERAVETDLPPAQLGRLPRGPETILLVEDEELVRNLEREVLERCGYTVLEATGPSHALELAARHQGPIDLLLTDVVMPELGGRELAEQLAPRRPRMRVLYTSGYTGAAVVRHGVLEHGIAFLPKPLTPSSLAHRVRAVLDGPVETEPPAHAQVAARSVA